MFNWKEYEKGYALFLIGKSENVAFLERKGDEVYNLKIGITGYIKRIKAFTDELAKLESEKFLIGYWRRLKVEIDDVLNYIN